MRCSALVDIAGGIVAMFLSIIYTRVARTNRIRLLTEIFRTCIESPLRAPGAAAHVHGPSRISGRTPPSARLLAAAWQTLMNRSHVALSRKSAILVVPGDYTPISWRLGIV